jgi:type I restriction enzyme S subunit
MEVKIDSIKADSRYSLVGGPFGSNLTTRDYVEEGIPVIRGNNLSEDRFFDETDFVFVSEQKANRLLPNNAFPGDLIFTQRGTLGQVGLIPLESQFQRYVISQSQMKLTVNPQKAHPRFVYYFFRHPSTIQEIKNRAYSSGVPHINLATLKELKIPLPALEVQEDIVSILSAYDDLIENNLRRIKLLEESACLLFKEWFVRLRFPGHEHTRIVNGEPAGWEKRKLADVCDEVRETVSPRDVEPDTPYIGLEQHASSVYYSFHVGKGRRGHKFKAQVPSWGYSVRQNPALFSQGGTCVRGRNCIVRCDCPSTERRPTRKPCAFSCFQ